MAGVVSRTAGWPRSVKTAVLMASLPTQFDRRNLGDGCWIKYQRSVFPEVEASQLFTALKDEVAWTQRPVVVMGKAVLQPRLVSYQADSTALKYTYSRVTVPPDPWQPVVKMIKVRVEELTGEVFNSCLLNYYRSGGDHLSWHSDSEPLYGACPTIASVSFGSERDFVLRNNADRANKLTFPLGGGAVLVMGGHTQTYWQHAVPKRAKSGPRISLTFRNITLPEKP